MSTTRTVTTATIHDNSPEAGSSRKRKAAPEKTILLKAADDEEDKKAVRKLQQARRTREAHKTVIGNSRNISAGKASLRKLIVHVWNEIYTEHEPDFVVASDTFSALNYYLIGAYESLFPQIATAMFRMQKAFKTRKGQRTEVKARINSNMVLASACSILPASIARDMQDMYAMCMGSEEITVVDVTTEKNPDGKRTVIKYDMSGLLPKNDQGRMANLYLKRYSVSTKAKIAISCYCSAILRREIALGFALMLRAWKIDVINLNKVLGAGKKTLSAAHLYIAVGYDSPEYNEDRVRGLAAFYSANSPTQSQGLHYMPVELCSNPTALARYYPGFSNAEELEKYEQRMAERRTKQKAAKRAKTVDTASVEESLEGTKKK